MRAFSEVGVLKWVNASGNALFSVQLTTCVRGAFRTSS